MKKRIETLADGVTLHLGDCLEILPTLPKHDAVITDPPYGINYQSSLTGLGAQKFDKIIGDIAEIDLSLILNLQIPILVFGANNFPAQLPQRGRWLCWDKRTIDGASDAMLGSPFELAWSNKKSGYDKIVRILHGGVVNADGKGLRVHPTQKPVGLMKACIEWVANDAKTILDPFMGSGTTGVAAVQMGRKFTGIEISERYFDISCKRVEQALAQPDMLIEQEKKHEQIELI